MNLPDPLNQFNRLIEVVPFQRYDLGSRWLNRHGDEHVFDAENCMATMGAVGIDHHTGGRIKATPGTIRNAQTDFSGGIGVDDVADAWMKLWHEVLLTPLNQSWADAMAWAREGRFVIAAVDYRHVPYAYQEQKNGNFDHALGFCDVRSDGTILRYDGLGRAPRRVPQLAVRLGAEALAVRERGSAARLFLGITGIAPVPPANPVVFRFGGKPFGRGRFLSRGNTPNHLAPVRSAPSQKADITVRLRKGQSFKCAQTTDQGDSYDGNTRWYGTADGRCWINSALVWYAGPSTGKETVR